MQARSRTHTYTYTYTYTHTQLTAACFCSQGFGSLGSVTHSRQRKKVFKIKVCWQLSSWAPWSLGLRLRLATASEVIETSHWGERTWSPVRTLISFISFILFLSPKSHTSLMIIVLYFGQTHRGDRYFIFHGSIKNNPDIMQQRSCVFYDEQFNLSHRRLRDQSLLLNSRASQPECQVINYG